MKYTVTWTEAAKQKLADIWINATDRWAVTVASHQIDRELRIDAHQKGQLIKGGRRLFRVPPLAVVFIVSPDDCLVTVLQVARLS